MALRLNPSVRDHLPYHMIMLEKVRQRIDQFDILHFHIDLLHGPLVRAIANWTLTTLHGRLDLPDLVPFYQTFRELPLVSISNDQRRYLHNVNWLGTVYHGLPRDLLAFHRALVVTSPSLVVSRRRNGPISPSRSQRGAGCR
jgi:hypothetical protein